MQKQKKLMLPVLKRRNSFWGLSHKKPLPQPASTDDIHTHSNTTFFSAVKNVTPPYHDCFFNPKDKALYEALLAAIFFKYRQLYIPLLNQVFAVMIPGLTKVWQYYKQTGSKNQEHRFLCEEMYNTFIQKHALPSLYHNVTQEPATFFHRMIMDLQSEDPDTFFKKLAICRAYLTFFMGKGQLSPHGEGAIKNDWEPHIDLKRMLGDTVTLRDDWFLRNVRKNRPLYIVGDFLSRNIGYLPPYAYNTLSKTHRELLINKVPEHEVGGYIFSITTLGDFTSSGSYTYSMPQLCGPSGMTAMYLALAAQTELSQEARSLYSFIMSLYTVGFGGHSIDETFIMGSKKGTLRFNEYQRGDYLSIIPAILKHDNNFADLYQEILNLNQEFLVEQIADTPRHMANNTRSAEIARHSQPGLDCSINTLLPAETSDSHCHRLP
ncbi:hypothetical protein [Legionella spiritensis]|uniref:hypothetical protein n=1 Tax=Legionella spiritensis TaxID=452 RepID=UPI000F6E5494|nr:hypothetical protein [Legionella spiritensis]VEG90403.1 Uncharacterised protein [Legionella spiritensis]